MDQHRLNGRAGTDRLRGKFLIVECQHHGRLHVKGLLSHGGTSVVVGHRHGVGAGGVRRNLQGMAVAFGEDGVLAPGIGVWGCAALGRSREGGSVLGTDDGRGGGDGQAHARHIVHIHPQRVAVDTSEIVLQGELHHLVSARNAPGDVYSICVLVGAAAALVVTERPSVGVNGVIRRRRGHQVQHIVVQRAGGTDHRGIPVNCDFRLVVRMHRDRMLTDGNRRVTTQDVVLHPAAENVCARHGGIGRRIIGGTRGFTRGVLPFTPIRTHDPLIGVLGLAVCRRGAARRGAAGDRLQIAAVTDDMIVFILTAVNAAGIELRIHRQFPLAGADLRRGVAHAVAHSPREDMLARRVCIQGIRCIDGIVGTIDELAVVTPVVLVLPVTAGRRSHLADFKNLRRAVETDGLTRCGYGTRVELRAHRHRHGIARKARRRRAVGSRHHIIGGFRKAVKLYGGGGTQGICFTLLHPTVVIDIVSARSRSTQQGQTSVANCCARSGHRQCVGFGNRHRQRVGGAATLQREDFVLAKLKILNLTVSGISSIVIYIMIRIVAVIRRCRRQRDSAGGGTVARDIRVRLRNLAHRQCAVHEEIVVCRHVFIPMFHHDGGVDGSRVGVGAVVVAVNAARALVGGQGTGRDAVPSYQTVVMNTIIFSRRKHLLARDGTAEVARLTHIRTTVRHLYAHRALVHRKAVLTGIVVETRDRGRGLHRHLHITHIGDGRHFIAEIRTICAELERNVGNLIAHGIHHRNRRSRGRRRVALMSVAVIRPCLRRGAVHRNGGLHYIDDNRVGKTPAIFVIIILRDDGDHLYLTDCRAFEGDNIRVLRGRNHGSASIQRGHVPRDGLAGLQRTYAQLAGVLGLDFLRRMQHKRRRGLVHRNGHRSVRRTAVAAEGVHREGTAGTRRIGKGVVAGIVGVVSRNLRPLEGGIRRRRGGGGEGHLRPGANLRRRHFSGECQPLWDGVLSGLRGHVVASICDGNRDGLHRIGRTLHIGRTGGRVLRDGIAATASGE